MTSQTDNRVIVSGCGPVGAILTLALIPHLFALAVQLPPARMTVNYGLERVRFPSPVPAGTGPPKVVAGTVPMARSRR